MTYEYLKNLYDDIISMVSEIIVKREDLAKLNESTRSAQNYELYKACLSGDRYFYNFSRFDRSILEKYLNPTQVAMALESTTNIPEEYRAEIVEDQAKYIIENYVEGNEYYRMLMGLPPLVEHRFVYIKDHEITGIDPKTPIHLLPIDQLNILEADGTLDKLKKQYPNAKYLNYLGIHAIDPVTARTARPFDILYLGPPKNSRTRDMFECEYYKARQYVMSTAYNPRLVTHHRLYFPTIGVLILTLAIRNTMVPSEADYLNYEEILDSILESYGMLQYFEKFPFKYKKNLIMAIDKILAHKGTDGVLIDICELFNFDNFSANRYYLMKTHKKDADGNVIFSDNPEEAYDLNFVKSDVEEHEIDFTPENMISYNEVTLNDYLWQLTQEEKERIMREDFNLMMSKYINVEAAYEVTSVTFEICCFINLVLYSRPNLLKVRISNMYSKHGSSDVWTMIVFMLAALAQKSGFDGNIIYEPKDAAEILRFNYGDIQTELDRIVKSYEGLIDVAVWEHLLDDYPVIQLDKPYGEMDCLDTVSVYVHNRDLFDTILQEMHTTTDIRQYEALSNLKDLLFISASEKQSFKMSDGTSASTYREMLDNMDPSIGKRIDAVADDPDELNELILYVLEKLEDAFNSPELKYLFLNTPNVFVDIISKYLRIAINVFKASMVQLDSINLLFYLGDRDPIRVIDTKHTGDNVVISDTVYVIDELATHSTVYIEDHVYVGDRVYPSLF